MTSPTERRRHLALAICLLALAAGLRLVGIERESLWNDELATVVNLDPGPLSDVFWKRIHRDVHPPLYMLFMSAWVGAFGDSELALRAPSVLFGVLLCLSVYLFTRRTFGERTGVAALAFTALSPSLIRYSQEARSFSLVTFTFFLCLASFTRLLSLPLKAGALLPELLRSTRIPVLQTAAAGALTAYVHYSGLIAVAVLGAGAWCYVALADRRRIPLVAAVTVLGALLYAPWLGGMSHHLGKGGLTWLKPPTVEEAFKFFSTFVLPPLAWGLVTACAVTGGIHWSRTRSKDPPAAAQESPSPAAAPAKVAALFIVATAVGLPVLFFAKSLVSTPIWNDRNLLLVVPAVLVGAAWIVTWRGLARRWSAFGIVLVSASLLYHAIWKDRIYTATKKQDFRGAAKSGAKWLERDKHAKVVCLAFGPDYFNYYLHRLGVERELTCSSKRDKIVDMVEAALGDSERVVLLYGHIKLTETILERLEERFEVRKSVHLRKAGALLLARK